MNLSHTNLNAKVNSFGKFTQIVIVTLATKIFDMVCPIFFGSTHDLSHDIPTDPLLLGAHRLRERLLLRPAAFAAQYGAGGHRCTGGDGAEGRGHCACQGHSGWSHGGMLEGGYPLGIRVLPWYSNMVQIYVTDNSLW